MNRDQIEDQVFKWAAKQAKVKPHDIDKVEFGIGGRQCYAVPVVRIWFTDEAASHQVYDLDESVIYFISEVLSA